MANAHGDRRFHYLYKRDLLRDKGRSNNCRSMPRQIPSTLGRRSHSAASAGSVLDGMCPAGAHSSPGGKNRELPAKRPFED